MPRKNLANYIMNEGITGKVFRGVVGGRTRDYTIEGLGFFEIKGTEYYQASIKISLAEEKNLPKKALEQRERSKQRRETFKAQVERLNHQIGEEFRKEIESKEIILEELEDLLNFDYSLPLLEHYRDPYIRDYTN